MIEIKVLAMHKIGSQEKGSVEETWTWNGITNISSCDLG